MQIYFGFSECYDLKHRLSVGKKLSRKGRMRDWREARIAFPYSEQGSLGRIVGFSRVQYQKFWGNLKQSGPHREFGKNTTEVSTSAKRRKWFQKVQMKGRQVVAPVSCFTAVGVGSQLT